MALVNNVPLDGSTIEIQIASSIVSTLANPVSAGARLLSSTPLGNLTGVSTPPSRLTGVEAVSWNSSKSTQKPKGVGQVATKGNTPGIITIGPGSLEIWVTELAEWINSYGSLVAFYNQNFDITITYRSLGMPVQIIKLNGCTPIGISTAHQLSTSDNLVATLDFDITSIAMGANKGGVIVSSISNLANVF